MASKSGFFRPLITEKRLPKNMVAPLWQAGLLAIGTRSLVLGGPVAMPPVQQTSLVWVSQKDAKRC